MFDINNLKKDFYFIYDMESSFSGSGFQCVVLKIIKMISLRVLSSVVGNIWDCSSLCGSLCNLFFRFRGS